jgi:hypothetical protein|tara:strand:- start:31 stop:576 length:546 start_codon:yes stop_codon:yes gene_type:complete
MKKMKKTNVIKKLVSYGLTILIGFNLFTGCVKLVPDLSEEYNVSFQVGLPLDLNGYYHLTMDRTNWQTTHRVSGVVTDGYDNFVEVFWMEWESDLYWYLGDTLGYVITQYLNDNIVYVTVDTSYMIGFNGMEVPTSNRLSYSNSYGQLNNMIAPVKSMIGDTLRLTARWYDGEETFNIVLD